MPSSNSANDAGASSIWQQPLTLDALNAMSDESMGGHLGVEFVEIGPDYLRARMPVDQRTHQPFGFLHGGASVALAETVGSTAANCCVDSDRHYCVGLAINANHVRAVREGHVVGTARPLHRGRSTQVWEIRICDDEERLVCASRLTLAVKDRAP